MCVCTCLNCAGPLRVCVCVYLSMICYSIHNESVCLYYHNTTHFLTTSAVMLSSILLLG